MSTNGETADLMVREGIQITESALKLAGLGAKNLAAQMCIRDSSWSGKTNRKWRKLWVIRKAGSTSSRSTNSRN